MLNVGPIYPLDAQPLDFHRPSAVELRDTLARAYRRSQDIEVLLDKVGISPADVFWEQPMTYVWHDILRRASDAMLLGLLVTTVLDDPKTRGFHTRLQELAGPAPIAEARGAEGAMAPTPDAGALERLLQLGVRHFVDVSVLEGGYRVAPAVVRLTVSAGGQTSHGTGFLLDARGAPVVVTNHHVLFDGGSGTPVKASRVEVWLSYELGIDGFEREKVVLSGDVTTIVGQAEHDWGALRLTEAIPGDYPRLRLHASRPIAIDDRVYIVQHPCGGPKQVTLAQNQVTRVDDQVIQYIADTEPGSSGAPVFNERWEIVALHHRWVEIPQPDTTRTLIRNQGIRIERVREGLEGAGLLPRV